jgi:hypothetical protein
LGNIFLPYRLFGISSINLGINTLQQVGYAFFFNIFKKGSLLNIARYTAKNRPGREKPDSPLVESPT